MKLPGPTEAHGKLTRADQQCVGFEYAVRPGCREPMPDRALWVGAPFDE